MRRKNTEHPQPSSVAVERAAPLVEAVERRAVTTSMAVAEFFGKSHKHVLEAIRATIADCPDDFREPNFRPTFRDVPGPNGAVRQEPCYQLTRDAFALVSMGFTGQQALAWKIAYIQAFNAMEKRLRHPDRQALGRGAKDSPFAFEGTPVRARMIDGQPWVSAMDMCQALGVAYTTNMLERFYHVRPEWTRIEKENGQGFSYKLNYCALPAVVQFCTRASAPRRERSSSFLRWIVNDVLPKLAEIPQATKKMLASM